MCVSMGAICAVETTSLRVPVCPFSFFPSRTTLGNSEGPAHFGEQRIALNAVEEGNTHTASPLRVCTTDKSSSSSSSLFPTNQATNQASKQATKPASKQATKPASKQQRPAG